MNDAVVVEHDALARIDHGSACDTCPTGACARSGSKAGYVAVQHMLRQIEHIGHVLADGYARNLAMLVQFDHALARAHIISAHARSRTAHRSRKEAEVFRMKCAEIVGNSDAVEKQVRPALHAVGAAMQELDTGSHLFGGRIGMQFKRLGGVGQIGRFDMGPHIEVFAEEGWADMPHQLDEIGEALIAVGHFGHDRHAFNDQRLEPGRDFGFVSLEIRL